MLRPLLSVLHYCCHEQMTSLVFNTMAHSANLPLACNSTNSAGNAQYGIAVNAHNESHLLANSTCHKVLQPHVCSMLNHRASHAEMHAAFYAADDASCCVSLQQAAAC
jgi:hypothetical protein